MLYVHLARTRVLIESALLKKAFSSIPVHLCWYLVTLATFCYLDQLKKYSKSNQTPTSWMHSSATIHQGHRTRIFANVSADVSEGQQYYTSPLSRWKKNHTVKTWTIGGSEFYPPQQPEIKKAPYLVWSNAKSNKCHSRVASGNRFVTNFKSQVIKNLVEISLSASASWGLCSDWSSFSLVFCSRKGPDDT